MIKGTVKGQALRLYYPTVVSDTVAYLTAEFSFLTDDWKGLSKWAHFKNGDRLFSVNLVEDKIRAEDHLNLSAGEWEVYLHGAALSEGEVVRRITTQPQKLIVAASGVLDGEPLPITPPSVGEQILATAEQALAIAEELRAEANEQAQELDMILDGIIGIQEELIGGANV